MHQIDVLISGKQAEWAAQWAGLETQLREKERELAAVRHTLWQKDTEVRVHCCATGYHIVMSSSSSVGAIAPAKGDIQCTEKGII